MAIDPGHLINLRARGERVSYTARDVLLYSLGVGFGRDPERAGELPFVYEGVSEGAPGGKGLRVPPTFASAVAQSNFLKGCGWDEKKLVPGSERVGIQRPLPPSGTFLLDSEVTAIHDLGHDAGALVMLAMTARSAADQQPLFTVERGILARGDGGFGGTLGAVPAPPALPFRSPDLACDLHISPEQALIYRLSGDMNPIHADPQVARSAGLPGPVLQNLCTLGVACRGVLETICEFDPLLITGFEGRYTGGVYPGDDLRLEMWQDANIVSYRVLVPARDRIAIDNGRCVLLA